jgi:hypothetical protein
MVQKSPSGREEMSDAYLDRAANWADLMVKRESRGSGDIDNARHRVAQRHGVPYSTLFALKWRKPKCPQRIRGIYEQMREAYLNECKRQVACLEQEIQITEKLAGPDDSAVVQVKALVEAAKAVLSD